ncbi:uncharacterized protein B0T23DRAFT_428405 [Neurospora hispaniola]|uniref:DUF7587 domain-containing protein n=1 Tax=Neurospora hispaniola TaxID=588809 RepID=A0AAJ0MQZ4_9PEZI|nr:hypothetical protein B0T23DRAFT_428405 [Neurospora hispaniola]
MTAVFWHIVSPDHPTASLVLPPKLFYVRHGHSQAYATADGGFVSRAPDRDISDEEELKKNATMHFDWTNWGWESCFISAFSDQGHAEKWGRRACFGAPVTVYALDTQRLPPGTLVLNAFMLCISLGISNAYNENSKDEFLFYKGIPGSCVESSWDPWGYCPPQIGSHPPMRRGFLSSWVDIVKEAEIAQTIYQVQTSSTSWTTNSSFSASPAAATAATAARQTLDGLMREEGRLRQELEELEERQQESIVELNNLNNDADADADAVYDPNAVDVDDVCDLAGQMEKVLNLSGSGTNRVDVKTQSPESNTSDTIDDADVNNPTGADGQMKVLDAETNLDAQSRTIPEVNTAENTVTTMTEATIMVDSAPAGAATGP